MNTLYGLLTDGITISDSDWYKKKHTPVFHTDKSKAIRDILIQGVPANKAAFFACVVCSQVLFTDFGEQIRKLDTQNTYTTVQRQTGASQTDPQYCFYPLTQSTEIYSKLKLYLDSDIQQRLNVPTWFQTMAAGCLQMLREGLS